uniref:Uncharacterized protein n=1 Tax=Tanacetum cinerariifolium TaxID=118510 RepID=A0A6L2M450_TANCI|nr:hypothetical protein [Tanacetum cinerariifolium]
MAFISSAKHNSENEDGNTACVPTASTNVPTASASIDEDDMEEMDIKWNMALLSMRADQAPRNQDRGRTDNYRQGSKAEEQAPKALMAIDRVGWDWSYIENNEEDHALVANEVAPTESALMANTSAKSKKLEILKEEKEGVDGKLAGLLKASKYLDNLIESQSAIFLAVASLFFWQWQLSSLAVGSCSASGNSYKWQWECLVHFIPNK